MSKHIEVFGIETPLITPETDIFGVISESISRVLELREQDIIVVAESVVATAQGRLYCLKDVVVSEKAEKFAKENSLEPRFTELVLREADEIIGVKYGVIVTIKDNMLVANAGIDTSNAPPGYVVATPEKPDVFAKNLREYLEKKFSINRLGVVISDSRVVALRLGCTGIAMAVSGFRAVKDLRGQLDIFGKKLKITYSAVADMVATAAQIVMGEAADKIPVAVVRGIDTDFSQDFNKVETIERDKCLYMGFLYNKDASGGRDV